jgi:uncharacterized repeat protein (TIGR01451 family)
MTATFPIARPQAPWLLLARGLAGLFLILMLGWLAAPAPAHAAPPLAGASISNQASATYSDGSGVPRSVTSNVVQTVVSQVHSVTLASPGAQNATAGSVVYYPHTLTNTGNGSDTFNLSLATSGGSGFTMSNLLMYLDNGSGAPTGLPITSTGAIAAGATFKFIVTGTVPGAATNGQTNTVTVTGTSVGDASKTQSNSDVTTATSNAVITLNKSISAASGAADGTTKYTYTITYTNTGNSTATNVAISDTTPAGMVYAPTFSRWSVTGVATALSETGGSVGTAPNTLVSSYASGKLTATIATVTPGQSGFISFQVTVPTTTPPSVLPNTASVAYNNGAGAATATSNQVDFTVTQTAAVALTGATVASANAGSTVSFSNQVKNNGNGTDTFNITLVSAPGSFPAGTSFQLYKSDGSTPLVDTNADGVVDTGPLAAGATYNVILKATLPPSASGTGPFAISKTATSIFDNTKFSTAADTLTAIVKNTVDLAHVSTAAGSGIGVGPEVAAQATLSANPGSSTAVFTLVTKNTGPSPDSYNLFASTDSTFAALSLPAGWTVSFKADGGTGTCSSTGATITNTGSVASAGFATVCAVVSIPAGYDAGTNALYFRALSPTSAAVDGLHDAVIVNAVRSLSLTPSGTGQTYPGGSYVYTHALTNTGNVTEGSTFSTLTPAIANGGAGWTSTLYYDSNGNGSLDAADLPVGATLDLGTGLAKGTSITLFDKVIAPSGAAAGSVNATTITVTTANGTYTGSVPAATVATDSTTVISGNLTLLKEQALDLTCNGSGNAWTQANLAAKPDECVMYRITVTNVGAASATNVVVSDATPSFTTLSTLATTAVPGFVTTPAVGATGTVKAFVGTGATASAGGTLASGESATVTFGVRITP